MNRYKKANRGIHAPEDLKEKVVSARSPARRGHPVRWAAAAAVLAVALLAVAVFWPGGSPLAPAAHAAIVQAEYPDRAPYPEPNPITGEPDDAAFDAWWEENRALNQLPVDNGSMTDYYAATMAQFLGDNGGENAVYSPLNLYLALAMLAETTGGDSRAQILDLLGAEDLEALRTQAGNLWNANYRDDGHLTSILANSVWLDEDLPYNRDSLNTLADRYYTSSYQGEMGSQELNQLLQGWLNDQTGGLLKEYADGVELAPDTVLALASTIYFKAAWNDEFNQKATAPRTFHGTAGDVTADFMNQTWNTNYYWADHFSAVSKGFQDGGEMWLIRPDEGIAPEELLAESQLIDFLTARWDWEHVKFLEVNLSLPKFDVAAQTDLTAGLQALGVTDVFDPALADFTPVISEELPVWLSQVTHAARVKIDEKGCEAAAFTVLANAGAAAPPDEQVDFVLDRPFLFAVTSRSGQLLFMGIVNQV